MPALTTQSNTRPGIDLQSQDPFATFTFMREHHPVCQVEPNGLWAISRYQDIKNALAQPLRFSSKALDLFFQADWLSDDCKSTRLIVSQDPPEHKKYHSLLNKAFVNSNIRSLMPLMRKTAKSLIDGFGTTMPVDFMSQFSYPYIGGIISQIVGVGDKQSFVEIREWVEYEEQMSPYRPSDEFIVGCETAIRRQNTYFIEAINERRCQPQDDLLSGLIAARIDHRALTDNELCSLLSLMISAGFTTTVQAINHAIIQLSRRPEIVVQLKASPALIPGFIEELLRHSPPLYAVFRIASCDIELHGVTIPKGEMVLPLLASGNRDPAHFSNPDQFDIFRKNARQHLTFGHGIHICIGAALARLEMHIALECLLDAFSEITCPADHQLDWIESISMRAVSALPVQFST